MSFILFLFELINMKFKKKSLSSFIIYIFILSKKWVFPKNGKKRAFWVKNVIFWKKKYNI